jgi:hypothetical protein
MNMLLHLVSVSMNENDTRMLIILLIVLLVLFILVGLLGMAIRYVSQLQAKVIDNEMGDLVIYKVVSDVRHFKKLATQKNNRLLVKKGIAPITIGFVALMFYIIYAGVTGEWGRNYFGEFGTLFFMPDWANATYGDFWGFKHILTNWPPVIAPAPKGSYWPSYILCPLVYVSVIYYVIVVQGYLSRFIYLRRIGSDIYNVNLQNYKYYDHVQTDAYGRPINPTDIPAKPQDNAVQTAAPTTAQPTNPPANTPNK